MCAPVMGWWWLGLGTVEGRLVGGLDRCLGMGGGEEGRREIAGCLGDE
jgi:hypothetical protein